MMLPNQSTYDGVTITYTDIEEKAMKYLGRKLNTNELQTLHKLLSKELSDITIKQMFQSVLIEFTKDRYHE